MSEAEYAAALTTLGLPENLALGAYAGGDTGASQGALFDESGQLSALIGRSTTPLSIAVANALR